MCIAQPITLSSDDVCCLGRSGLFYFPTCFLLRFVSSSGLFTHVLFRHVVWSLRHVVFSHMVSASFRLFSWLVYAYHVPACFMVALFAWFVLLACLRMSCSGMSYGRSGMFYFLTRCLLRFVCSAGLFTHVLLRHSFWSLRHVVVTYCHVFALSITASFRVFRHV